MQVGLRGKGTAQAFTEWANRLYPTIKQSINTRVVNWQACCITTEIYPNTKER